MTQFIRIIPRTVLVDLILSAERKIVVKATAGNHKVIGGGHQAAENEGCIDHDTAFVICSRGLVNGVCIQPLS
jgi:hypothetical protein